MDPVDQKAAQAAISAAPAEFTPEEIKQDQVLKYFHYQHLPAALQPLSKPFCELARFLVDNTPRCAERTVALRKLVEAKDCAVRSVAP